MTALHPLDARLLGLDVDAADPCRSSFVVEPHLTRSDGRLYGGCALAVALAAIEAAADRPVLYACVQFVGTAAVGETVAVVVELVARGRNADQAQLRATVGDRVVFTAVGGAATRVEDGISGTGSVMPDVVGPDECPPFDSGHRGSIANAENRRAVMELREVPSPSAPEEPVRRIAMWGRLTGERETTAAKLGFLADFVPIVVTRAAGVIGAGTSLDNTLRVARLVDSEWVLLDLIPHVAYGSYGHGTVDIWTPDGVLLATGSQTAKLFSFDSFTRRRRPT